MSVNATGQVDQRQQKSPLLYGVGGAAVGAAGVGGATYGVLANSLNKATAKDATKETVDAFVKSGRVQNAVTELAQSTKSELEAAQKSVLELVNSKVPEGGTKIEKYADDMLDTLTGYVNAGKNEGADDAAKGLAKKAQDLLEKIKGTPAVAEVKDEAGKITTPAKAAVKGLKDKSDEFTQALYTTKEGKEVLKEGDELTSGIGKIWKNSKDSVTDKIKSMNKKSALKLGAIGAVAVGIVAALIISSKNKKAAAEAPAPEASLKTTQA